MRVNIIDSGTKRELERVTGPGAALGAEGDTGQSMHDDGELMVLTERKEGKGRGWGVGRRRSCGLGYKQLSG